MGTPAKAFRLTADEVYGARTPSGARLSPDGRTVALVLTRHVRVAASKKGVYGATNVADVFMVAADGGSPQPLTCSGDVAGAPDWSPDGARLLIPARTRLMTMNVATGESSTVCRAKPYGSALSDHRLASPQWSPNGESILFAGRGKAWASLRLTLARGGPSRRIAGPYAALLGWDWSPDGKDVLFTYRTDDASSSRVGIVEDVHGKCEVRGLWTEPHAFYALPAAWWVRGGSAILFRSNRSGWSKYWISSRTGSDAAPVTTGAWDDGPGRLDRDRSRLVFASRAQQEGTGDDLWEVNLKRIDSPRRLTTRGGIHIPADCFADGRVIYLRNSPLESDDLWRTGLGPGSPIRLTFSTAVALRRKLTEPEEIRLPNDDGTSIAALVYRPAGLDVAASHPAIVWIRGGPTGASRFGFDPYCNWLANEGFVVVVPNYRGSVGAGVEFMNAVAAEGVGRSDLSDVLATATFVRSLPGVDLSRGIGVGGRSWGGYLTLMAMTNAPGVFSCGVAGAAITDWNIQQSQTEVRFYDRWLVGGWIYDRHEHAKDRSPVHRCDQILGPLLVYHGDKDRDVPHEQIVQFVRRAQAAGVDLEYVELKGEGHGSKRWSNRRLVLARTAAFYRRHLQPWDFRRNPCGDQVYD